MKNMHALALCAILTPAFALTAGSASAQDPDTTTERAQAQAQAQQEHEMTEQEQERELALTRTQTLTQAERQNLDNPQTRDLSRDSSPATLASVNRPASQTTLGQRSGDDTFLSAKPARGVHADQLIGSEVKGSADGDELGTINDLIIDENGQIVAVIVGVGGFLGMGERDVAIGWDALQRTARTDDDDGYDYRFVSTMDTLKNAPEYKKY